MMIKRVREAASIRRIIEAEHERTGGIFRLAPCWVGRPGIIVPGRRLKLQDDYINRDVAVNERWLASTTYADNGKYNTVCPEDHGLSYIVVDNQRIQLKDALGLCGDWLLGEEHTWDVLPRVDMDLSCVSTDGWFEPVEDKDNLASFPNLEAIDSQCPEREQPAP